MKISTKGLYGLRAMVDLAIHYDVQPITLKRIAERQDISEAYLEQIFAILRKGEIVKSIKGPQGGYMIEKPLKQISVGDILILLEGQLFNCEKPSKDNLIDQVLHDEVWEILDAKIRQVVTEKTIDDLVDETIKRENKKVQMYYI